MRKYFSICIGLVRLLIEIFLSGFKIKIHGFLYCISSGVKLRVDNKGTIDLGRKTWISENCIFQCGKGCIVLGNNNFFNTNCRVVSMEQIVIGDNNLFGPNLIIVDHDHRFMNKDKLICQQGYIKEKVKIGSDNWIGGNVTICKGVNIGDHVVIGANSVVNRDCIEPGVYAGVPARKIREY